MPKTANRSVEVAPDWRKARNQYMRDWRKKNQEKVQEYNARYWKKKLQDFHGNRKSIDNN